MVRAYTAGGLWRTKLNQSGPGDLERKLHLLLLLLQRANFSVITRDGDIEQHEGRYRSTIGWFSASDDQRSAWPTLSSTVTR